MITRAIALQRLAQQRLTREPFTTPAEVVAWMGAVQAQDYPGAKWSLGLRLQNAMEDKIEKAYNEGDILRTHVMRPTWHFVTPDDIRWILDLTAPRVNAVNAGAYRELELDKELFLRANEVLEKILHGNRFLTRAEIGSALAEAGIFAEGRRLAYIVSRAELDGVLCSGPRKGKQFTYALLEERASQARILKREEALAELIQRYFTSHGPATIKDFTWWSGLTVVDARAGLEMVASPLAHEVIDGQTYWFSESGSPTAGPVGADFLLPTYDEYLVGYAAFDKSRRGGEGANENVLFNSAVVIGGKVSGSWRRSFRRGGVVLEVAPFVRFNRSEEGAVAAAARRYAEFIGLPVNEIIFSQNDVI